MTNELNHSKGENTIKVKPNRTDKYKLKVCPILGGEYTGSITFTSDEGHYQWYTIGVKAESSKSERTIDLNSYVRKAVSYDIELSNPTTDDVVFRVILEGKGVMGEPSFHLGPKSAGKYTIVFSPLYVFKDKGTVAFINETLGETWFELALNSEENPPHKLPVMRAELGKIETTIVTLENPIPREVKVAHSVSNTFNFELSHDKIVIPANSHINIEIRYIPSDLENTETGTIAFETEEIGSWTFLVFGIGIPPTRFPVKTLSGSLNKDCSGAINFKNPFREPIAVNV